MRTRIGLIGSIAILALGCGSDSTPDVQPTTGQATQATQATGTGPAKKGLANVTFHLPGMNVKLKIL